MHTLVDDARVQLHRDRRADNLTKETGRVAGVVCGLRCAGRGAVGSGCGHFCFWFLCFCVGQCDSLLDIRAWFALPPNTLRLARCRRAAWLKCSQKPEHVHSRRGRTDHCEREIAGQACDGWTGTRFWSLRKDHADAGSLSCRSGNVPMALR